MDQELIRRFAEWDIHTSGPLWGNGDLTPVGEALAIESAALAPFVVWREGLERLGLKMERRPLRVRVDPLTWHDTDEGLLLCFELPRGSYATALLRELVKVPG